MQIWSPHCATETPCGFLLNSELSPSFLAWLLHKHTGHFLDWTSKLSPKHQALSRFPAFLSLFLLPKIEPVCFSTPIKPTLSLPQNLPCIFSAQQVRSSLWRLPRLLTVFPVAPLPIGCGTYHILVWSAIDLSELSKDRATPQVSLSPIPSRELSEGLLKMFGILLFPDRLLSTCCFWARGASILSISFISEISGPAGIQPLSGAFPRGFLHWVLGGSAQWKCKYLCTHSAHPAMMMSACR